MLIDIRNFKEVIVTDQKPYSDGVDQSFEILNPGYPSLSHNNSKVVFTLEKFVTGSQLVQVDLRSGRWSELFSVEHYDTIASGKFKGMLLVGASQVGKNGRGIYYKICDHSGRILLEFNGYDDYMKFRSDAIVRA